MHWTTHFKGFSLFPLYITLKSVSNFQFLGRLPLVYLWNKPFTIIYLFKLFMNANLFPGGLIENHLKGPFGTLKFGQFIFIFIQPPAS